MTRACTGSFALAIALPLVSCSYDWSRGAPAAVALPPDASDAAVDAQVDAAADTFAAADATDAADAADAKGDASDGAPDCATLIARVESARGKAKACASTAGVCSKTVVDECGCDSIVAEPTTPETKAYADAARALRLSTCDKPRCGASCRATASFFGFCLVDDAGTGTACAGP